MYLCLKWEKYKFRMFLTKRSSSNLKFIKSSFLIHLLASVATTSGEIRPQETQNTLIVAKLATISSLSSQKVLVDLNLDTRQYLSMMGTRV